MSNKESGDEGKWKPATEANMITYKYELRNMSKNISVSERDPERNFLI